MRQNFFRTVVASALLLCGAVAASAQSPVVQQSPTHLDAATNFCVGTSGGTLNAVNATFIATCTPPAGLSVYLTSIEFDVCTNGTGTAQNQVTFTTTGLVGAPVFQYSVAATASICQHWNVVFGPGGVKGTAPGTAVVITSPAAATNNSYNIVATAYYAP